MALVKATITTEHSGAVFSVMFNPEEYAVNQDNTFASQSIPGLSGPVIQFAHGGSRTLDLELLFDTYEQQRDVRQETERLIKLMRIDPELHAPPILRVEWASLQFRCVLTRANQRFILFLADGRPVRARVTTSFQEFIDPEREAKEVSRQTADYTKLHTVAQGETLSAIAGRTYGDPRLWRVLAVANGMDDPFDLRAGRALVVPAIPYVDAETGELVT
ncbi:LysM domain-containing protein [Methylobacterium currus]|jgi:LysM repeat protein|uniref:LysM domain-containing protein n=1 Tax=Methylobacterium currus TaxID=2051553 RepID=A0A2R4WMP4_9HYPH|nr:LysM peptidoglycan-binding domain-containing protein [Methylobacterium currus]AWB22775.1 LysM domain-containing protein [Methylobacterium currus]UHC17632.1 LysM peptidoglycan-binding domain-containing protein [Methylobacterium currus]